MVIVRTWHAREKIGERRVDLGIGFLIKLSLLIVASIAVT